MMNFTVSASEVGILEFYIFKADTCNWSKEYSHTFLSKVHDKLYPLSKVSHELYVSSLSKVHF